jgi:hypothetical protein
MMKNAIPAALDDDGAAGVDRPLLEDLRERENSLSRRPASNGTRRRSSGESVIGRP